MAENMCGALSMDYYEAKNFVWLGICEIIFLRGVEHYVRQHRASASSWSDAVKSSLTLFTMDYFLEKAPKKFFNVKLIHKNAPRIRQWKEQFSWPWALAFSVRNHHHLFFAELFPNMKYQKSRHFSSRSRHFFWFGCFAAKQKKKGKRKTILHHFYSIRRRRTFFWEMLILE